jgi:hypothetical protein
MRRLSLALLASLMIAAGCSEDSGGGGGSGGSGGSAGSGGRGGSGGSGGTTGGSGGSTGGSGGSTGGTGGSGGSTGGSGGSTAGSGGAGGSTGGAGGSGGGTGGSGGGSGDAGKPEAPEGGAAPAGLTRIFDGTGWDNWVYNPVAWKIVDGAMRGQSPSGQSQAFTKESYSNFRLILKSRMVASNDHLGVCLWGNRPNPGSYGFGACLLVIPPRGSIWDYSNNTDHPRPELGISQNEWHTTEILANRTTGKVLIAVNGKLVHTYMDTRLNVRKHGPIGMQIHKAGASIVEYKDIDIEVDPKNENLTTLTP